MSTVVKSYTKLSNNIYIISGAINTGILVRNNKAVLIDCCDTISPEKLLDIGVDTVDMILFTQHRRTHTAGAYQFINKDTRFLVSHRDRHLFENAEAYWEDQENRWHLYHYQPGPLVMTKSLSVSNTICDGDTIEWEGFSIKALETPGPTDGSISYILRDAGKTVCFSGDVIYGYGQVFDLYSLQKGFSLMDYHGFIGNIEKLEPSLKKLQSYEADVLVPSHGDIIINPLESIIKAMEQLDKLYKNYYSITSINYYFPDYFKRFSGHIERMKPAVCIDPPDFIRFVDSTSSVLVSENGSALLIDCGNDKVVNILKKWILEGRIKSVDACWVTHYHDDHVDAISRLVSEFSCKIVTTAPVAEIIEHPSDFFLPCISPCSIPVGNVVPDGFSWEWDEFRLTAFHFPGQTFYHSGLLVEGYNKSVFLAGDSFSPTGIDDYCCGNRNFLGEGIGYRYCIDILRRYKPDYILNQHQTRAFKFTDSQLDYMELKLIEREKILTEILPWNNPNFGLDEWWVRTYPYEQEAAADSSVSIELHFTNHDIKLVDAIVQPLLPDGWELQNVSNKVKIAVPPQTFGSVDSRHVNPDEKAIFQIKIPNNIAEKRYMVAFRITWDGRYLGQFRHASVLVKKKQSKCWTLRHLK
ncbi:MAG: MBL fold metallo-hydrolase [Clostridiales bacterium]|nr:MBL fold metallo-hydrolase [Clostridiales bacterium]